MVLIWNNISFIGCLLFVFIILQEIEAQLDFYRSPRRISPVFPRASPYRPRSISPLRSRSIYPQRSRLRQRPLSREVSVPSVRRSPVPGQGFSRSRASRPLTSRSLGQFGNMQREITAVRRNRFIQELPSEQQRIRTAPRSLQVGQVAPGAYPISYTRIAYRNNNNNFNNDRNFPNSGVVNTGMLPRVKDTIGRSLTVKNRQPVRTSNILPVPLNHIQRQSQKNPQYDFPKVWSKQRIQSFTVPTGKAQSRSPVFSEHQNKILEPVPALSPLISSSVPQAISQRTVNTNSVLVKTMPSHTAHINIGAGDGDSSTVVLQARMSGVTNPVVKTLVQPSQDGVLSPPNVATISASDVDNSQIQIQSKVHEVQPKSPLPADTLHQDLVDAFTKVIESVLVPQSNVASPASQPIINDNINTAALPIAPPTIPVQQGQSAFQANMVPAYAGINHYSPSGLPGVMMGNHFSPYNQFGHMASFGYMNPWMSPAMMQEMMFGDTTDPPDGMTTTAAPANVSSANITENTTMIPATLNDVLVDTTVAVPVVSDIKKLKSEANVNDKMALEPMKVTRVEGGATLEIKTPIKQIETSVEVVLKPTDTNVFTENVGQSLTDVNMPPDSQVIGTVKSKSGSDKLGSLLVKEALKKALKNVTVVEIKPEINKLPAKTLKVEVKQRTVKSEEHTKVNTNNDGKERIKIEVRHHSSDTVLDSKGKIDVGPENPPKGLDLNMKIKPPEDSVKIIQQSAVLTRENEKNTDKTSKNPAKVVDKNQKLIIDIAALIRKSKVDLKHLSNMISGEAYPKIDIKPAKEPVPTAEQLGIKLKGLNKGKSTSVNLAPTPAKVEYTLMPRHIPTIPPVPEVPIGDKSTVPPLIPKGLIFTRQPEIYRTLTTILKHNPGALKKVLPTNPTTTNNTAQSTLPYPIATARGSFDYKNTLRNLESGVTEVSSNTTATVKPHVPVMLNAIDQNVKMQEINKDDSSFDSNGMSVKVDSSLHQQLKDLNVTDGMTNGDTGVDIAKYLADPTFVDILRKMLQGMTGKEEVSTHGYNNALETTTFVHEVTTTSYPVSTTEEYELEDYITEAP